MPGTPRKKPEPVEEPQPFEADRPKRTVADLQEFLVELLHHVTLRDAKEQVRLRSFLTGEEVPEDADEESAEPGDGEE